MDILLNELKNFNILKLLLLGFIYRWLLICTFLYFDFKKKPSFIYYYKNANLGENVNIYSKYHISQHYYTILKY